MTTFATVADIATITPGTHVLVEVHSGNHLDGTFVSINSKGINVRTTQDGVVKSRSLGQIMRVGVEITPDVPADLFDNDATYTAGQLAAILDMVAKDLRVQLRAMNLNVGKGHRYVFTADDARTIAAKLTNNA